MRQKQDGKFALRSAYINRGLKKAGYHFPQGNTGVFMQVTLAILYMYLIFLGYVMMGTAGLVFVSVLFLVALSSPFIYYAVVGIWRRNRMQVAQSKQAVASETEQKA